MKNLETKVHILEVCDLLDWVLSIEENVEGSNMDDDLREHTEYKIGHLKNSLRNIQERYSKENQK